MDTEFPPVEEIIEEMADDDAPLLHTKLAGLSGMSTADMETFTAAWTGIEAKRRRMILEHIIALAEDDFRLDFDAVFKYCLKDEDAEVRRQAIEGLWEVEETAIIAPLIDMLENDPSEEVRAAAAEAIGKFAMLAEHGKIPEESADKVRRSLLEALSDNETSVEVRRRALEAAAPLSIPEVRRAIEDAYKNRDVSLKASAVYAMGKNCDPHWMPVLLRELSNAEAELRYEAAGACGELEEEEAVPLLIKMVDDPDSDVQMAAIQALGKINNQEAVEFLRECLESDEELVRQTAEQVLNETSALNDPLSFEF